MTQAAANAATTATASATETSVILPLETPACDLCGARDSRVLFPARDLRHRNPGEFFVVECEQCQLRYLSPRPRADAIAAWYPRRYAAHSRAPSRWRRFTELLEDKIWNAYLRMFLTSSYPTFFYPRHERDFTPAGRAPRLLDIGCGSGDKLRYIRAHSTWQTFGVDFNSHAVDNANARGVGDVRLSTGDRLPFDDGFCDAVMSWHSLEHHHSPRATMREAARVLRPGGYGIFAVPSGNNRGLSWFRGNWGPLEAPRHLYHFTEATLRKLVATAGLDVVRVVYDFSFYGLFLDEEIFESLQNATRARLGKLGAPLQLPLALLKVGGLLSSAATIPILPFNRWLGRWWRGTNLIVHVTKPGRR